MSVDGQSCMALTACLRVAGHAQGLSKALSECRWLKLHGADCISSRKLVLHATAHLE